MKKYLKSAAAVLLGSTFAFSAVACDSGNSGNKAPQANDYYESLFTAYENMKGLKLSTTSKNSESYAATPDENYSMQSNTEALFSFTKDGVRAHESRFYIYDDDDEVYGPNETYYIDGLCYEKEWESSTDFYWEVSHDDDILGMDVELPAILGEFTPADIQKMLADYKEEIVAELKKGKAEGESYKVGFTYDAKKDLNAVFGFLDTLELKKEVAEGEYVYTTVADVIDAVLKAQNVKVGEDYLTTATILETIAGWGNVTVGTAVSALERAIGMTLDQLKEKILSSSVVTAINAKMQELSKKPEYKETAEMIVSAIAQAKEFKIAETLALVKDKTLDEVLAMVWPMIEGAIGGGAGGDSAVYAGELVPETDGNQDAAGDGSAPLTFAQLSSMLGALTQTSLVDLVVNTGILPSEGALEFVLDQLQATTFAAASVEFELTFSLETGALTNVAFESVNSVEVALKEESKETTSSEMKVDAELLYSAPTIEIPEGKKVVDSELYDFEMEGIVPADQKENVQVSVFIDCELEDYRLSIGFSMTLLQSNKTVRVYVELEEVNDTFTALTGKIVRIDEVDFDKDPNAKADCLAKYGLKENVTIGVSYDKETGMLSLDVASIIPTLAAEK